MRKIYSVLFLGILFFAACKKEEPVQGVATLPYENEAFHLELINASAPPFIRDIHFLDGTIGIAVNHKGEIFRTNDGGLSWELKHTNPNPRQPFYQILFTDQQTGYVVGGSNSCGGSGCIPPGGYAYKTDDGGNSWTKLFQVPKTEFSSIAKNSAGDLFVLANGIGGFVFRSTNAGNDWTLIDSFPFHIQKINFTSNTGFITGVGGHIIKSSDNGSTWITSTLATDIYYNTDIEFVNGSAYCLSNNKTIFQSADNGNSWVPNNTSPLTVYTISPLSPKAFLAFGAGRYTGGCWGTSYGAVRHSADGGKRWIEIELRDTEPIRYTSFISPTQGFAVAGTKLIRVTVK